MIDLILVFISSIIFVRGLTTLIFLFQSLKWLSQKSKTGIISKNSFSNKVYLVIPVLREQDRIIETLDYIRKNVLKRNMEILVVTTQKEFEKNFANAHCVGHGLIIKAGLLKSLGGFSENCVTEDLFLGFLIRSSGANIY